MTKTGNRLAAPSPSTRAKVSVIIAVRNGGSTLRACLASIQRQQGCRIEVIVVDAVSTDETEKIVLSFNDSISTYIREPDGGIYDAWNKALRFATSEWCLFLGADDKLLGVNAIKCLLKCAETTLGPPPDLVVGCSLMTGAWGQRVEVPNIHSLQSLIRSGGMIPHTSSMTRTSVIVGLGGFDSRFQIFGDRELLARMLDNGFGRAALCDGVVVQRLYGGASSRWSMRWQRRQELWKILRPRVGSFGAALVVTRASVQEEVGGVLEALLVRICGLQRGRQAVLFLRRKTGRVPQLKLKYD